MSAWLATDFLKHDYNKAESQLKRSLAIKEKILGPVDVQVADTLSSLARVLQLERKYDEAEALYLRAIRIREEKLNLPHRDDVETMKAYACLNIAMMPSINKKAPQKVSNQDEDR